MKTTKECSSKEVEDYKIRNLINVNRFSGKHLLVPESTSDHSMDMAMIAIGIADRIHSDGFLYIDIKDLVYRCVIHDLDEAVICDVPRSLKYHTEELAAMINNASQEILSEEVSPRILEDVKKAKDLNTVNGCIVKILDVYQCYLKLRYEVNSLGNHQLKEVLHTCIDHLDKTMDWILNKNPKLHSIMCDYIIVWNEDRY